ncbi:BatD family protein [Botryobacter ruber]|uniref:BatD family protein n=1 Tax=Botryobacter ruber TaxID=2171629 RepID=UPI000FEC709D|nr:BatD family protein [Botryobacter ruber]
MLFIPDTTHAAQWRFRFMRLLLVALFFIVCHVPVLAQQVSIELGKTTFPINQYFTVSVVLENQELKEHSPFPDIEGFKKSSRFSSTKTITAGGKSTVVYTLTQNYAAFEEGEFELEPFTMRVNGQTVQSKGAVLQVQPMAVSNGQGVPLPEEGLTDEEPGEVVSDEPQEYIDMEDNAFLSLYTNKQEVFIGEGLTVALYFYLAIEDQRLLDFYDFGNQISTILRQLKQPNAWEETFETTEITPEEVTVGGKSFLRFKLYEAVMYPINPEPLTFPALSLKMIKYKVAKNLNLLSQDRLEGYKTFFSWERVVSVKELPPHPLREQVPVGIYSLQESLSQRTVPVNKSVTYQFRIVGEGNLAAILAPEPAPVQGLEFYPPDLRQDITRRRGRVVGAKTFAYRVIGREPGTYPLHETMQWIFFNPVTAAYDTLRPSVTVHVTGERDTDALILSRDLGPFYKIIQNEDDTLVSLHSFEEIRRYTNIILLVLLLVSAFVFYKKEV